MDIGNSTLRVMTWNIWWRFGPWEQRRAAVLHTLRQERPDVLGLQEVWGSAADGGANMAQWLAAELDMHWAWSRSPVQDRWHGRNGGDTSVDVGIAVLSRHPLRETAELRLPAGDFPDDGKTALHALIDTPGGPLPFFTTHLNSGLDESAVRCDQVRALAAFVRERAAGHAHPPVVTGDLNAEPDFDEVRLLCGHKTAPAAPGVVLLDSWRFADPRLPHGTWDVAHRDAVGFGTEPSCIDYILVGPQGPDGRGRVRHTRRAADTPVDGVWASDHAAVVTELACPS